MNVAAQQITRSANHTLALKLAGGGIPTFPCLEAERATKGAKAPYTNNGFKDATTDVARIDQWWTQWPNALPGMPTGDASGVSVIDADVDKETGEAIGLAQIQELSLDELGAVRVNTPSGGLHLIFAHTEGASTSSKQIATHVDVRGEGGYIIAPGTMLPDGTSYSYEGINLSQAMASGALTSFPVEQVNAAIAARKAKQSPQVVTQFDFVTNASTEASEAETLEVLRTCLAEAPNTLPREDWVKLAGSLKAGFGDALQEDFTGYSMRYSGGAPCTEREALGIWSSTVPHTVTSEGPALALLKGEMGGDAWKGVWRGVLGRRDNDQHHRHDEKPYTEDRGDAWPSISPHILSPETPKAPPLPLAEVLTPKAADWVAATAEAAGAPADYVLATLLSVTGATIGNSRWVSPWQGWYEPPVLWTACIGNPSAGKSPAIDAVLAPLRRAEKPLRQTAEADMAEWESQDMLAKIAHQDWESKAKKALSKGEPAPSRPETADPGPQPHIPRLVVNDGTVERLGIIAAAQPKGFLQFRDELAGWLKIMETRNGGSDRAFWLEAYGGKGFSVERVGRAPLSIDRLTLGVCGGIQPGRLNELLIKSTDDGLLARFIPIWPERIPPRKPERFASDQVADEAMSKLAGVQMPIAEDGELRPWFVGFDNTAEALMSDWRTACAEWESEADGLLLSFIGKLPGMAARLSLVLAALGYAFDDEAEPSERQITHVEFGRACHFLESYALSMARRAYQSASVPDAERAARRLLACIRNEGWKTFTSRDATRKGWAGLKTAQELQPAVKVLLEADALRECQAPPGPRGGRPTVAYDVNPQLWGVR